MHKQLYNKVCLCLLAILAFTACNDDTMGTTDTTTLNLVFSTRAANGDDENALEEEGIKTLRVIIVDTNDERVDVNELYDFTGEEQPLLSKTLTIIGLPAGEKDFYVIANEASVGLTGLDSPKSGVSFGDSEKAALLSKVIDGSNTYFPNTLAGIGTNGLNGLPIAGMISATINEEVVEQTISIPITRAVAKFELCITNKSEAEFQLTSVNFGPFITDRTYLFPSDVDGRPEGLPSGVDYNTDMYAVSCDGSVIVSSNATAQSVFTGYIYETGTLDASNFTLSLTSTTTGFAESLATAKTLSLEGGSRNYISRGDYVQITGTVNVSREVDFEVVVIPWDENDEITIPAFDEEKIDIPAFE